MNLDRRQLLKISVVGLAEAVLRPAFESAAVPIDTLRIALLHLAPRPGEVAHNRHVIETAVTLAANLRASWVITPELSVSGYAFAGDIGTDWILPQPDAWMQKFCRLVARLHVTVFLSSPERDHQSHKLYNSVFVIAPNGTIIGTHRKINTLRVGSESWSSPGDNIVPFSIAPFAGVGILICADAFSPHLAASLKTQGAQFLVSSANWAPGLHGPNGEWERCTVDTGLPLLVCNRTGPDRTLDFTAAQSVIVKDGHRLLSLSSEDATVFVIDWNMRTQNLVTPHYQRVSI
jgi:N-carbamoylputrescine amidase